MPIDGHAYLVSQGWTGKGTGLRHGAIAKPVTVTQKKTLSGIGKDRDDAFPFWDHVFSAAADKIKVKIQTEDDSDGIESSTPAPSFKRTSTGIISNKRPPTGIPAISGSTTPEASTSGTSTPRMSLMAAAKQEAARRMLYSMFFRGPIMRSDYEDVIVEQTVEEVIVKESVEVVSMIKERKKRSKGKEVDRGDSDIDEDATEEKKRNKSDKAEKPSREERKKLKRSRGDEEAEDAGKPKKEKKRRKEENMENEKKRSKDLLPAADSSTQENSLDHAKEKEARRANKAEKKARKEEKTRLKAQKKIEEPMLTSALPKDASTGSIELLPELVGGEVAPKKRKKRIEDPSEEKGKKKRRKERDSE